MTKYLVRGEKSVEGQLPVITFHAPTKDREKAVDLACKYLKENETAFCVYILNEEND